MTEPKVFLIARPSIDHDAIEAWLEHIEAKGCLRHIAGQDIERLLELAGRRCYKSFVPGLNPNVTKVREDSRKYHENVISQRHGSVLEHGMYTFAFEGVSRVFTHELVRHRVGTAFSQESLRYVRLTGEIPHWVPPIIRDNPQALALFEQTFLALGQAQDKLAEIFAEQLAGDFAFKKELTSAFRRIAPIGLATGIVFSANVRTLRHLIPLRTAPSAEYEMRVVFGVVARMMLDEAPMLFPDMEVVKEGGLAHYRLKHEKV